MAALVAALAAFGQKTPGRMPITVFAFGTPEGFSAAEGFDPAALLKMHVMGHLDKTSYQPMEFSRRSSTVQLALEQSRLKSSDIEPPFNSPEGGSWRAVVVGKQLRTPMAMAGNIETYQFDEQKHTGTVVVTLDVYDVNENKVVISAAVTGKGQGGPDSDEAAVMSVAVADAAEKIMGQISEPLGIGKSILDSSDPGRRQMITSGISKTLFAVAGVGILIAILAMRSRN